MDKTIKYEEIKQEPLDLSQIKEEPIWFQEEVEQRVK